MSFFDLKPIDKLDQTCLDKKNAPLHPLFGHVHLMPMIMNDVSNEKDFSKKVFQFLQHVAYGEQDAAELMLKENPLLALAKGNVTDYSGRNFQDVTGFQYALWALDAHMWNMIKQYIPSEEVLQGLREIVSVNEVIKKLGLNNDIKTQFKEVEEKGVTYISLDKREDKREQQTSEGSNSTQEISHSLFVHGGLMEIIREYADIKTESHYDFQLIKAWQDCVSYIDSRYKRERQSGNWTKAEWDEVDRLWEKGVGGAQRLVPAFIANYYCSKDVIFTKQPDFSSKKALSRSLNLGSSFRADPFSRVQMLPESNVYFPLDKVSNFRLGVHFGICKGCCHSAIADYRLVYSIVMGAWELDVEMNAMIALRNTRYQELEDLKVELSLQQSPSLKLR